MVNLIRQNVVKGTVFSTILRILFIFMGKNFYRIPNLTILYPKSFVDETHMFFKTQTSMKILLQKCGFHHTFEIN